ncbi:hypothetical protein B566_EDAN015415 [Ephemera danica]|nr:hypothetical protein B566_EDAN015415 [Ephemera danica]
MRNKPLRSTMLLKCVVLAWMLQQAKWSKWTRRDGEFQRFNCNPMRSEKCDGWANFDRWTKKIVTWTDDYGLVLDERWNVLSKTCVRLMFFNSESTPADPGRNRILETSDISSPLEATIEANNVKDRELCISIVYLGQGNLTLLTDGATITTVIPSNTKCSCRACEKGHFGANCDMKCSDIDGLSDCKSVIACSSTSCSCLPGYHECGPNKYGSNCQDDCGICDEGKECFHSNGSCPGNSRTSLADLSSNLRSARASGVRSSEIEKLPPLSFALFAMTAVLVVPLGGLERLNRIVVGSYRLSAPTIKSLASIPPY